MSAGMETQRLISVSLGKIAQSRCQRGGINLHRNLLVATVLHKARSAYMIDSYNYQQNLLQRQKQHYYQTCVDPLVVQAEEDLSPVEPDSNKGDVVCLSSCEFINLGQPDATPTAGNDNELISDLQTDCETVDLDQTLSNQIQDEAIQNKENSPPPSSQDCSNTTIPVFPQNDHTISAASSIHQIHVSSSNQLSQEVQITLSTANPTCKVLKRSRSHIGNSSDNECSSTKQVKLSCETPSTDSSNMSSTTDVDLDTSESSQSQI
uniref:Immediate early response gene 5-like protein n=1 Tax=Arion vulgaris TaxID=1028688 RepID=A0A0B7AY28_9EUPU